MNEEIIFKWHGDGFSFGQKVDYFCLEISNIEVELIFCIHKSTSLSDEAFKIERANKNVNTINIRNEIDEKVQAVYLVKTDETFRKKFKRSYYIIRFFLENESVFSIGAYSDSEKRMTANNCYLICTLDFINLLADASKIIGPEQLVGTIFEPLKCLFSKKELAIELLKS